MAGRPSTTELPVVGGFFGHHRNFACPESPTFRAEDDLGGEHGLPTTESVFRLPVDCRPARIFGGLSDDHSDAAIAEAARREELPFLRE